jgi:hypothetical protein
LATVEESDQFAAPASEVLKAGNLKNRVSRCQVCSRNPIVHGSGVVDDSDYETYSDAYDEVTEPMPLESFSGDANETSSYEEEVFAEEWSEDDYLYDSIDGSKK